LQIKNNKKPQKKEVFHHEPLSIIVFYDYVERVSSLEKNSSSSSSTFKNNTLLKKVYF
jgi:hypothetical protein